jgi:hypothetical protein
MLNIALSAILSTMGDDAHEIARLLIARHGAHARARVATLLSGHHQLLDPEEEELWREVLRSMDAILHGHAQPPR